MHICCGSCVLFHVSVHIYSKNYSADCMLRRLLSIYQDVSWPQKVRTPHHIAIIRITFHFMCSFNTIRIGDSNEILGFDRVDSIRFTGGKKKWIYEATKKRNTRKSRKTNGPSARLICNIQALALIFNTCDMFDKPWTICYWIRTKYSINFFLLLFIFAFMFGLCSRFRSHSCSRSTLSLAALKTYTRNYSVKCNLSAS